jgi:hypothetical protein
LNLYGCDGKVRWRTEALPRGAGVHMFADRLFVVEELAGRATLRDLQGRFDEAVLLPTHFIQGWKTLSNGNVVVVGSKTLYEIGSAGQTLTRAEMTAMDVQYSLPMRGSRFVGRTKDGVAEIDAATARVMRYAVDDENIHDILLLATNPDRAAVRFGAANNNIVRRDRAGNVVWRHPLMDAAALTELPSGHVVAGSRYDPHLYELTPDGRTVWEIYLADTPLSISDKYPLLRLGFERPPTADANLDSVDHRIKDLKNPDERVRKTAFESLAQQGPQAERALPALLEIFDRDDDDDYERRAAIDVFSAIGVAALPALVDAVRGSAKARRIGALRGLERFGGASKPAVPTLVALVEDAAQDADARLLAASVLGKIGPGAEAAVPALVTALKGDDDALRKRAALSLMGIGMRKSEVFGPLFAALKDREYPNGRCGAATALGALGTDAEPAVPELKEIAADDWLPLDLRRSATQALGEIGPGARPTLDQLASLLRDSEEAEDVRLDALNSLYRLRGKEVATLPAFIEAMSEEKLPRDLREAGLAVLRNLDEDAIPVLTVLVLEGHPKVRAGVIDLLKKLGGKAESALGALQLAATEDDEWSLRKQAASAFERISDAVLQQRDK